MNKNQTNKKKKKNTKMPLEFVSSFLTKYYKGVYVNHFFNHTLH